MYIDDILMIIVVPLISTKSIGNVGKMMVISGDNWECSVSLIAMFGTSILLIIIDVESIFSCYDPMV